MQRLRDEHKIPFNHSLQRRETFPSVTLNHLGRSLWKRALLSAQTLLGIGTNVSAADHITSQSLPLAQSELVALLLELKRITEGYLEKPINQITVTTPSFFTSADRLDLNRALAEVSLHPSSCGEIEKSSIAATIATRFSQFPPDRGINMTSAECILGSFGLEEVVTVEYTEDVFAFSIFKLFVGKQTWKYHGEEEFVAIRNISTNNSGLDEDEDGMRYWNEIEMGIRQTALRRTMVDDRTLRLVLHGPSSLRPKVLSTIRAALGSFLPNASQPRAIRMILTREEMDVKKEQRRLLSRSSMCVLFDQESEWWVKDYEEDLLITIYGADNGWSDFKQGFVGSRGAALMGLHYRTMSCKERQAASARPWVWDNERSSSFFYPGEHAFRE